QGKANTIKAQTNKRRTGNQIKKKPPPQAPRQTRAARQRNQEKANAVGKRSTSAEQAKNPNLHRLKSGRAPR
ncbi:hypothetical protein PQR71_38475, partial [Paraburkholderia fungorum]|uniref:hypothetical protein n=1 Tax=Paraburkholderia fungorum TaxID=134537 RepID=UPI0038BC4BB3